MNAYRHRISCAMLAALALLAISSSPADAGSIVRFAGGGIEYTDFTGVNNYVTIAGYSNRVVVTDTSGVQGAVSGCVRNSSTRFTCTYPSLSSTRVAIARVGGGNDHVRYTGQWTHTRTYDGSGNDVVNGSDGNDVAYDGSGNDKYYLNDGDDTVKVDETVKVKCGDCPNDDVAYGGSGNDTLNRGAGADRLFGGPGNDRLEGGPQNDRLWAGPGNDLLIGDSGNDVLVTGPGIDRAYGGPGRNIIDGRVEIASQP